MGERPWIPHDGTGCPVPVGATIDVMHRGGCMVTRTIKPHHLDIRYSGVYKSLNPLFWAVNGRLSSYAETDVIAYRLSNTDDKAKREARIELFRGIAKSKEFLIEETLKPREKVK